MKPTNKLRFVRRTESHTPQGGNTIDKTVTILQQQWQSYWWPLINKVEWRDVPLEIESEPAQVD